MKPVDINQILQSLSEGPAEGVSLMALARSTGKSLPELQKFLQTHRVCFIETGQTKYKLNPNPPVNGLLKVRSLISRCRSQRSGSNKYSIGWWYRQLSWWLSRCSAALPDQTAPCLREQRSIPIIRRALSLAFRY